MDGIALASVVTSGVIGLGGLAAAVWSTRQAGVTAREGQVRERRIDAYLELLRLVEHKSLWYATRVRRAALVGDEFEKMPDLPREPDAGERATIDALLAAFGNSTLRTSCVAWTDAADQLDELFEIAAFNWEQDYQGPDTPTDPADLTKLKAQLRVLDTSRREVEVAISREINSVQGRR